MYDWCILLTMIHPFAVPWATETKFRIICLMGRIRHGEKEAQVVFHERSMLEFILMCLTPEPFRNLSAAILTSITQRHKVYLMRNLTEKGLFPGACAAYVPPCSSITLCSHGGLWSLRWERNCRFFFAMHTNSRVILRDIDIAGTILGDGITQMACVCIDGDENLKAQYMRHRRSMLEVHIRSKFTSASWFSGLPGIWWTGMTADQALTRLAEDSFSDFPDYSPDAVKMAMMYGFIHSFRICDLVSVYSVRLSNIDALSCNVEYLPCFPFVPP